LLDSQTRHRLACDGLLDRFQNILDAHVAWVQEHVSVFGHDYVRPQLDVQSLSRTTQSLDEPLADVIVSKHRHSMKAAERQLVSMTRHVKSIPALAME
jgi:hypothetical protein